MKKMLSILASVSILVVPTTTLVACTPFENFPSFSFETDTDSLETLFPNSKYSPSPVEFKYLKLINSSFEHGGFEDSISRYGVSIREKINLQDIEDEKQLNFINKVIDAVGAKVVNDEVDLRNVSFKIQNIYINQVTQKENKLYVESVLPISIYVG